MSEYFLEKFKTRPLISADKVLSLQCEKDQDIKVISSLLQDSLISNADIYFERTQKTFAFIANRFCWERVSSKNSDFSYYRVLSGVNIQNVISVKQKNLIQKKNNETALFYNLLTIEYDSVSNEITLVFSQGISVKLNISQLNIFIRDLDEPFPTQQIPDHFVESSGE